MELSELKWSNRLSAGDVANLSLEEQQTRATHQKRGVLHLFASLEGEVAESVAHL